MSSKSKSTDKKEETTPARVPKLRFPEFRGEEGWAQQRLIDTADRSVKWSFIGGPFGSNLKSSDYVTNGVRIIQLQNIGDGEFHDEYRIFTTEEKADELLSNNIYPGEIIMSKMGDPVGRACLIPEGQNRYVMCSDGIRLVVNERQQDKYFIYSLINSPLFRSVVEKTATGSTRKRIGLDELKSLPMRLPKKPEQQKIAECLRSVDALIAAQARKVDALKTHKKGLMQQLFPGEGETQPRLRFPEFQNAGEWLKQRVSEILVKRSIPIEVESENVYREIGVRSHGKGVFHKEPVKGMVIGEKRVFQVVEGALVFNIIFAWEQAVATTSKKEVGMIASHRFPMYVPKTGRCNVEFMKFVFLTPQGKHLLGLASPGGAGRNRTLGQNEFKRLEVVVPERDEQRKIANCLNNLDTLITVQTQKLEAFKTHKKGLMQQLFPSSEEVVE